MGQSSAPTPPLPCPIPGTSLKMERFPLNLPSPLPALRASGLFFSFPLHVCPFLQPSTPSTRCSASYLCSPQTRRSPFSLSPPAPPTHLPASQNKGSFLPRSEEGPAVRRGLWRLGGSPRSVPDPPALGCGGQVEWGESRDSLCPESQRGGCFVCSGGRAGLGLAAGGKVEELGSPGS